MSQDYYPLAGAERRFSRGLALKKIVVFFIFQGLMLVLAIFFPEF